MFATNSPRDDSTEPSSDNEQFQTALHHHGQGLAITLCAPDSKKPLGHGWTATNAGNRWQHKRWSESEIERAFEAFGSLNVGCLLGRKSALIDFEEDSTQARRDLARLFESCDPPVTPTFKSRRGAHRLYAWDRRLEQIGKATVKYGALEIKLGAKGKGAQSLLPPSTTDGFTRTWLVPLDECPPAALPDQVVQRILTAASFSVCQPNELTHREHRAHKTCPVFSVSSVFSVCQHGEAGVTSDSLVQAAIEATLPKEPGNRHRLLFLFARYLKAMPQYAETDVRALKPLVQAWHRAALPYIETKPFEETWLDFAESWPKIQFPAGQEPVYMAYQAALATGLPTVASQYEQEPLRRLVALCRELQRVAGNKPFFLAGRVAAELLNVPHTQVAKWLRLLVIDQVLDLAKAGTRHQASEYRYRGG